MARRVITISREYGSGGRTIGRAVADRLGIAFYDRELIANIAQQSGLNPAYIAEFGEYATSASRFFHNLDINSVFPVATMPVPDQLYIMQYNAVAELAEREPCVIVGRCSDYVLRERDDCLHVFLHAETSFRAERIVTMYGETTAQPERLLEETDAKRTVYYEYYTGRTWGMAKNYHVCLNSGSIDFGECTATIVELAKGIKTSGMTTSKTVDKIKPR